MNPFSIFIGCVALIIYLINMFSDPMGMRPFSPVILLLAAILFNQERR